MPAFTAVLEGFTHLCDLIANALIAASHHADPALEVARHDAAEKLVAQQLMPMSSTTDI